MRKLTSRGAGHGAHQYAVDVSRLAVGRRDRPCMYLLQVLHLLAQLLDRHLHLDRDVGEF